MITRDLGEGFAPDVGFVNGNVVVAFGTTPNLQVVTYTPRGDLIHTESRDGFFDSFPRIDKNLLVYKAIDPSGIFPAVAVHLVSGRAVRFPTSADGNWPCVVVDAATIAWQTTQDWHVWLGSFTNGGATPTALLGAPDGIESVQDGAVTCRKDIRLQDPEVGGYPSYAGDLTVGQYGYGIGVRINGNAVRLIAGDENDGHPDPRCDTDGTNYAIVCWGKRVRLYLGTKAELLALPLATAPTIPVPTFSFLHEVILAPFKDPDGSSGATHEICVNGTGMTIPRPHFAAGDSLLGTKGEMLGLYSESSDNPKGDIARAAAMKTRLLLLKDGPGTWEIPSGLRKWDIVARELYLVQGETFEATVTRWKNEVQSALTQWSGDVCVVPMFYCQGGAPPNEVWPVADVLRGLTRLSEIVNTSTRIKLIAPFAYLRENGITGHIELQQAWANLKTAAAAAGLAFLTPVPSTPIPPIPPDPPKPVGPFKIATRYEVHMSRPVGLRMGQFFARIDPNERGKGPFGWYPVHFDQKTPDNTQCRFTESTPHGNEKLLYRHDVSQAILGADATEFGTDICGQFYGKPDVSDGDSGGYENFNGWTLGGEGINIILVQYNRDGAKYTSACLTAVPL